MAVFIVAVYGNAAACCCPRSADTPNHGRRWQWEYDIDYRAWRPLSLEELTSWPNLHFFQLDPEAQDRVGKYFLDRSERAREEALSPSGLAYPNRWLGPLTAPTHLLHPAIWSQTGRVPRNSFVGLRIYEESWDLGALRRDPAQVKRLLVYEYPHR